MKYKYNKINSKTIMAIAIVIIMVSTSVPINAIDVKNDEKEEKNTNPYIFLEDNYILPEINWNRVNMLSIISQGGLIAWLFFLNEKRVEVKDKYNDF